MLYHWPENSSTPGKPVLPWRKVNVLAIYTESNHEYRFSDPTTVVHSTDWLYLNTFPPVEDALPSTRRVLNTCKYGFRQFNFLAMLLNHTMNTHFLSRLQWYTVLTGSTRIPVHPWSQSGLVWFSKNGQKTDSPWWQNRFFRYWGVFCFLVAHDWWWKGVQVESVGNVNRHSWIRKSVFMVWFSINGQNIGLPLWQNQFSRCWASVMGKKVSRWNQSSLCATIAG